MVPILTMIGIDIVDIKRVEKIYQKHGRLFLEKILTQSEIAELFTKKNQKFFQYLCCYISCKEAVFKACSQEEFDWKEICISNLNANPQVQINRPNFNKRLELTFSVTRDMVLAQALVV